MSYTELYRVFQCTDRIDYELEPGIRMRSYPEKSRLAI